MTLLHSSNRSSTTVNGACAAHSHEKSFQEESLASEIDADMPGMSREMIWKPQLHDCQGEHAKAERKREARRAFPKSPIDLHLRLHTTCRR